MAPAQILVTCGGGNIDLASKLGTALEAIPGYILLGGGTSMSDITDRQKAIQAIIDSDKAYLSPAEIAPIIGTNPQTIRDTARRRPELLKFEFILLGNRTKIPRIPFLRYIGINVDQQQPNEEPQTQQRPLERSSMTNEELLLAITHEINTFKQEINERLDNIESQTQDLNNVLQSARNFINALSGNAVDK